MSEITKKDAEHIAGLARIKFSEHEKEKIANELGAILGYIDKLKEVDTDGVEAIVRPVKSAEGSVAKRQFNGASITGLENVLRKDEASSSTSFGSSKLVLDKKKSLEDQATDAVKLVEMAPDSKDNFVKVPSVF